VCIEILNVYKETANCMICDSVHTV
jgi:hypothetical protein